MIPLGPRLHLAGSPDMQAVGDALHTILCAVHFIESDDDKSQMISDVLTRYGVSAFLDDTETALMAGRFFHNLETELAVNAFKPEWPIHYVHANGQVLRGWVDLVVETESG